MPTVLDGLREELVAKAKAAHQVLEEAGPDNDMSKVKCLGDGLDTTAKLEKFRALNVEVADLHDKVKKQEVDDGLFDKARASWEELNQVRSTPIHPTVDGRQTRVVKSLGRALVESTEYNDFKGMRQWPRPISMPDLDVRAAVFHTGAGWTPEQIRLDRVEFSPQRPIRVIDFLPVLPTGADTIRYMEETTLTNNAAETAESTATTAADLIPESALALTERNRPVEWLPTFLPVTMQQMEDVEGIEAYVNSRLTYMIQARLDSQIIVGDGVTPNLLGTNSVSGINTYALAAEPVPDAIFKGMQEVRLSGGTAGFAEPSVVFINPADWTDIRLLRTADGMYIWGNPSEAGPERIWGVPVVQTPVATVNTATLGDYATYSAVYIKRGIDLAVSDSHSSYFTRGMLAIRADMRVAIVHFRPQAFCTVTGI